MSSPAQHSLFLNLFSKTQTRLYAFILMIVHNDNDAEEIFQETSSLLWEHLTGLNREQNSGHGRSPSPRLRCWNICVKEKKQTFFNQAL